MPSRRVALLGATGSIGRQAIDVVEAHPDLSCARSSPARQRSTALAAEHRRGAIPGRRRSAAGCSRRSRRRCRAQRDRRVRRCAATLWALEHGVTLALANKESLVAAGELALAAAERGGGLLLPVDSEHSALYQCLDGATPTPSQALVLTASGGPFRGRSRDGARLASPSTDALAHPTWAMGPKITVDSATLANKGLELIEAHRLFGVPYDRIEVVVHPTSIVHALVRFRDGALLAHLGLPDMRVPISFALTYPERAPTPVEQLDLAAGSTLEFEAPDCDAFPLLALARESGERGGTFPCAYNAANEVAVAAFLEGSIGFLEIAAMVAEALQQVDGAPARDLADARGGRRRGATRSADGGWRPHDDLRRDRRPRPA